MFRYFVAIVVHDMGRKDTVLLDGVGFRRGSRRRGVLQLGILFLGGLVRSAVAVSLEGTRHAGSSTIVVCFVAAQFRTR